MAPNVGDILATTLQYQSASMADAVSENNGLFYFLKRKGNVQKISGGYEIREPIMYAENGTAMWFSGYEQLNTAPSEVVDAAKFAWKQAAVAVTASGYEININSGSKQQLKDLLKTRIEVAQITMNNLMGTGAYAAGTGSGGKELGGLQYLFPTTEDSGTVGGIDRGTWSFWRHVSYSAATDGGAAASSANIKRYIRHVKNLCTSGTDKPDLFVTSNEFYEFLAEALQAQQIFTDEKAAEAGFTTLKFEGMNVLLDGGADGACPASTGYFINSKYLKLKAHENCFMEPLDPATRSSVNQDAIVKLIAFMGNLTCSNAKRFGLLTA